jgi:alkylation response protein AidB-like acyl-CoA dehydrogenase
MQTRAVRDGDEYVINGQKVWTSAGHRARWCWLAARTDPKTPKKHQGISLFIVDMKTPGVSLNPLVSYSGHHLFNEVFFDNVRIPASNLVGVENKGWSQMMRALALERHSIAPEFYGYGKRILEELVRYVKETRYGNRLLSQDPIIRAKLADRAIELETLKMFAYQISWVMSQGTVPTYEASRNKAFGDQMMERMAITGTEILGAYSQVDPYSKWAKLKGGIERWYLLFPGLAIAAGTDEVEKNIIGQSKLGLPKSY